MPPLFLTIKMSESDKSKSFINDQKEKYGKILFIEKVIDSNTKGRPDIQAIFNGMPIVMEAKLINSLSYRNIYPFKAIQLDTLELMAKAGTVSIGLLYMEKEVRYLMYYDLKEYLDKTDWDKAKPFSFEELRKEWLKGLII
jgi:hypothetical protein